MPSHSPFPFTFPLEWVYLNGIINSDCAPKLVCSFCVCRTWISYVLGLLALGAERRLPWIISPKLTGLWRLFTMIYYRWILIIKILCPISVVTPEILRILGTYASVTFWYERSHILVNCSISSSPFCLPRYQKKNKQKDEFYTGNQYVCSKSGFRIFFPNTILLLFPMDGTPN